MRSFIISLFILFTFGCQKQCNETESLNSSDTANNQSVEQISANNQVDSIDNQGPEHIHELVGIWQDSPEIASGYTDHYEFKKNGDFKFNYNEMICDKRTINYSGKWALTEGDSLKLVITAKTIIVGGKVVPTGDAGSCASDYSIEGGERKIVDLNDFQTILLSPITVDYDKRNLKTRMFDTVPFWKIEDPSAQED